MTVSKPFRLGVLGSGRGGNFAAVAAACQSGLIPAEVALVVSDVADAPILERARQAGLPCLHLPPGPFRAKLDDEAEAALARALGEARVDLVVLAGFMRILKGGILRRFPERVVNIHPSLLPAFPGLQAWKQAIEYGVKITGCTVHFVDQGVDTGPIILQEAVPVEEGDTAETLHARIQGAEHRLYPRALAALARGEVRVLGRRAFATAPH